MLKIAESAALKAGKVILQSIDRLDRIKISEKETNDFVTDIDQKAEAVILDILKKTYPDHKILAEESGLSEGSEENLWIIDPLDGTKNFIHGLPHFAISIAYMEQGKIQVGVIYDPIRDELFSAIRGKGATLNNTRIRVSQTSKLNKALIGTGFPFRNLDQFENYFKSLKNIFPNISGLRRNGSAALDLAYVAAGRLDGFWELSLKKWDIAAGILLVKEAGGLLSDTNGTENYFENGNIIAANPKIFKSMLQILKPSFETN